MGGVLLTEIDPSQVRPGALGLLVVLALAVATALLLRSFTRQLRRIDFDGQGPAHRPPPATGPGSDAQSSRSDGDAQARPGSGDGTGPESDPSADRGDDPRG